MKIKWRQHELLLVTLFTVISILGYIRRMTSFTPYQINKVYGTPFLENHGDFTYFRNILLLQIGTLLFLYFAYLWIRRFISPHLLIPVKPELVSNSTRKKSLKEIPVKRFLWTALQLLVIGFIIGPLLNMIFFVQNPYHAQYPESTFFMYFGSHPQPASNLFGGLGISLATVALYIAYAFIRESVIRTIEQSGPGSAYRTLVTNQFTLFLAIYFSIYTILYAFNLANAHAFQVIFLAIIPAAFLVYMCNTYWLFRVKGIYSFFNAQILVRLLLSTLIIALAFAFIPAIEGGSTVLLISWAIQLLVVTPLSWLMYQQKKDRLQQLMVTDMEDAAAISGS